MSLLLGDLKSFTNTELLSIFLEHIQNNQVFAHASQETPEEEPSKRHAAELQKDVLQPVMSRSHVFFFSRRKW